MKFSVFLTIFCFFHQNSAFRIEPSSQNLFNVPRTLKENAPNFPDNKSLLYKHGPATESMDLPGNNFKPEINRNLNNLQFKSMAIKQNLIEPKEENDFGSLQAIKGSDESDEEFNEDEVLNEHNENFESFPGSNLFEKNSPKEDYGSGINLENDPQILEIRDKSNSNKIEDSPPENLLENDVHLEKTEFQNDKVETSQDDLILLDDIQKEDEIYNEDNLKNNPDVEFVFREGEIFKDDFIEYGIDDDAERPVEKFNVHVAKQPVEFNEDENVERPDNNEDAIVLEEDQEFDDKEDTVFPENLENEVEDFTDNVEVLNDEQIAENVGIEENYFDERDEDFEDIKDKEDIQSSSDFREDEDKDYFVDDGDARQNTFKNENLNKDEDFDNNISLRIEEEDPIEDFVNEENYTENEDAFVDENNDFEENNFIQNEDRNVEENLDEYDEYPIRPYKHIIPKDPYFRRGRRPYTRRYDSVEDFDSRPINYVDDRRYDRYNRIDSYDDSYINRGPYPSPRYRNYIDELYDREDFPVQPFRNNKINRKMDEMDYPKSHGFDTNKLNLRYSYERQLENSRIRNSNEKSPIRYHSFRNAKPVDRGISGELGLDERHQLATYEILNKNAGL